MRRERDVSEEIVAKKYVINKWLLLAGVISNLARAVQGVVLRSQCVRTRGFEPHRLQV